MASKPANGISWASDANYASGSQVGQTTRLAPSAGYKAQGFIPRRSLPARYLNWVLGTISDWVDYLKDGKFSGAVSVVDGPVLVRTGTLYPTEFGFCDETGNAVEPARVLRIPLSAGIPQEIGDQWGFVCAAAGSYYRAASTAFGGVRKLVWEVPIPKGAKVTAVRASVERISGSGSIILNVHQVTPASPSVGLAVVSLLGTASIASGAPTQLSVTGSPLYTQDGVRRLVVSVTAPTGGAADLIHELFLEFSDPGPRNY